MRPTRYDVLMGTLGSAERHAASRPPAADRQPAPWESRLQATCECLSWRGSLANLERRRAEDELGEDLYAGFPLHARSALVTAHALLDKGFITEDELEAKMREVRARFEAV